MPRSHLNKRDAAALARLVERYGREVIHARVDTLPSTKPGRGRPKENTGLRDLVRWTVVQAELRTNRKLKPAAAAKAAAGKYPPGVLHTIAGAYPGGPKPSTRAKDALDAPRTLRASHTKVERMLRNDPELRKLADGEVESHIRMQRIITKKLRPLGLYRSEIIAALYDPKRTPGGLAALFRKYLPVPNSGK